MSYGRCVTCGAPGHQRERRPNGFTVCVNGHRHRSDTFDRHERSYVKVNTFAYTKLNPTFPAYINITPQGTGKGFTLIVRGDPLEGPNQVTCAPLAQMELTWAELADFRTYLNDLFRHVP